MQRSIQWLVLACVLGLGARHCAAQVESSTGSGVSSQENTKPPRSSPADTVRPSAEMRSKPSPEPGGGSSVASATSNQAPAQGTGPKPRRVPAGGANAKASLRPDASPAPSTSPASDFDQPETRLVPQIRIVDPPPTAAPWTLHERIGWGAQLGLAIIGYLGVLVALRLLRQSKEQLNVVESLVEAAVEASRAATVHARAVVDAQRPWIRISIERSREASNTLQIVATNHGRMPAEVLDCPDRISLIKDVQSLNPDIWKQIGTSAVLKWPILLMPGETTVLQRFGRHDAKWVCQTEETMAAVRRCEENIFIFGRVVYRDVGQGSGQLPHRTDWCFRYVHGESISDLVTDGPFDYNRHV